MPSFGIKICKSALFILRSHHTVSFFDDNLWLGTFLAKVVPHTKCRRGGWYSLKRDPT